MKIAAAAYHPQWHDTWDAMAAKLTAWVTEAADQGADLLVFPEYAGVEAGLIGSPDTAPKTAPAWAAHLADHAADWVQLHADLAKQYGVYIVAGSLPWTTPQGLVNAAPFCAPDGSWSLQEKLILTPYEREEMHLSPGTDLQLFETSLGKIGILICYDSEFPLQARALVAAGADLILVPSCTDFPAGQTRVRQSCRARAIEGQCLIVQAPLTGVVPDCEIIDQSTGRVGFFCPPDHGLPPDGIIAQGQTDDPAWVIADVDPQAIAGARKTGQVGNFTHWAEQDDRIKTVTQVPLG